MVLFALIYLSEAKKYIVVPESFIFDLKETKLKNYGVNRNQSVKVFWSNDVNCEIPNFDAFGSRIHPPIVEEACYVGHVYRFFETHAEAEEKRKEMRPIRPPTYNKRRVQEKPVPLCEVNFEAPIPNAPENDVDGENHIAIQVNAARVSKMRMPAIRQVPRNRSILTRPVQSNAKIHSLQSKISKRGSDVICGNRGIFAQKKKRFQPFKANMMKSKFGNRSKGLRLKKSNVFTETNIEPENQLSMLSNSLEVAVKLEPAFEQLSKDDEEGVASVLSEWQIGEDPEVSWKGEMPIPIRSRGTVEVKANDKLSGNMPFATNDDGDRSYIAIHEGKMKAITMPKKVVDGLLKWNTEGFSSSLEYDRRFLKLLIITCHGKKNVIENRFHPAADQFVKDLFEKRFELNGRSCPDGDLYGKCIQELQENNLF